MVKKKSSRETYGGLNDVLGTNRSPLDVAGVPLTKNVNRLAVDVKFSVLGVDVAFEAAMDGVVLEHVNLHILPRSVRTRCAMKGDALTM